MYFSDKLTKNVKQMNGCTDIHNCVVSMHDDVEANVSKINLTDLIIYTFVASVMWTFQVWDLFTLKNSNIMGMVSSQHIINYLLLLKSIPFIEIHVYWLSYSI